MKYLITAVVCLLLGASLTVNFFAINKEGPLSLKESEKKQESTQKQEEEKKDSESADIEKKYNHLVSKYNSLIDIYEGVKKENEQIRVTIKNSEQEKSELKRSVRNLKVQLDQKPKVKIVEKVVKEKVQCPVQVQTAKVQPVKVLPVRQEPVKIIDESSLGLEEVKEDFSTVEYQKISIKKETKKEPACVLEFKEKLAKKCLNKTKDPIEILDKEVSYRGLKKRVYYCKEVATNRVIGTFKVGPVEAKTYCKIQ